MGGRIVRHPAFDNREYLFIVDYLPWVAGDGMEHRNSTSITATGPLSTNAAGNVSTVAHEFFHAWNVERMRPKSIEPFDFEKANMSGELWFAEGFTNYYDRLIQRAESRGPMVRGNRTTLEGPIPAAGVCAKGIADAASSTGTFHRMTNTVFYYPSVITGQT